MHDAAVQDYLAALEKAEKLEEGVKSGQTLLNARSKLFEAEAGEGPLAAAAAAEGDGSVFFEEIKCLGFYPQERRLETCVEIKRPFGYGGNLGSIGSYEYVGWWVNWNNDGDFTDTGEDVCASYVHVFDPGLANARRLPICYATYRDIIPLPTLRPGTVVRARAILSWQIKPNGPNFVPIWGNRLECNIRIDPIE